MVSEDKALVEIELELPEHLPGPVKLPDGALVDIGDKVVHSRLGVGTVYRIATYHDDLGVLLCIEFPDDVHEMICLDGVKKVTSSSEKSPG